MELRQLRYFTQLAGTQNLVRAAKLLNITPPHLTQQIDLLEESLAAKLVDATVTNSLQFIALGVPVLVAGALALPFRCAHEDDSEVRDVTVCDREFHAVEFATLEFLRLLDRRDQICVE